jgi:hypothetical protein
MQAKEIFGAAALDVVRCGVVICFTIAGCVCDGDVGEKERRY